MNLSIIFVNWNSADYLKECIQSVYEYTRGISFEIIVVDNASTQPGLSSVEEQFPQIKVTRSPKNLGFAGANNLGFAQSTGDYVLFLNPDTKLIEPSINKMLSHIEALPAAGIVGCKLLNTDLSVQSSSIQKFPTILNQALDTEYLRLRWPHCPLWEIAPLFADDVQLIAVDVIPGACMLLRRDVFRRVGMFSEDYFMYAEDLDLNYKLRDAGYTNYYVGQTAIIHHGGRSSSRQKISQWALVMKFNAMVRLFEKTRGSLYALGYRLAMGTMAVGRLTLLVVAFPVSGIVGTRHSLRVAVAKWFTVLKWALGQVNLAQYE